MKLTDLQPPQSTPDLSSSDIIRKDLKNLNYSGDVEAYLKNMASSISQKRSILLRFADTIFWFRSVNEPKVFDVHLYTVDSPKALAGAINAGVATLQRAGVKKLVSHTDNEKIVKLLKRLQYPIQVKKENNLFAWTMEIPREI
jgi:hypothetical protein